MPNKFIPPQTTTTTRTAATPIDGEILYDTDEKKLYYGDGTTVGGKAIGSPTVADNVFRIQDNTDSTKQLAFETSGITTGTTRTLTVPDSNGTVLSTDTLTDKALYYYDASSKLFKPVGIGTVGQTLIAQPSSSPPYQWATPTGGGREVLTANRTYYVRTDGNDSNNGLTDTAGGAFLTIQKAIDVVASLDVSIYDATIQLADGTYNENIVLKSFVGSGVVYITGNLVTPSSVQIIGDAVTRFTIQGANVFGTYEFKGFKITSAHVSGGCFYLSVFASIRAGLLDFGATPYHVIVEQNVVFRFIDNYTISGSTILHLYAWYQAIIDYTTVDGKTVTLTGTPNFSSAFLSASYGGGVYNVPSKFTFTGDATGKRYDVQSNATVQGGGTTTYPGSINGTTTTGGQYA